MDHVVFSVGGTGQLVLQYYFQLYFVGEIREPFSAIVIDSDDLNEPLETIRGFLKWLQVGDQLNQGVGCRIPTIDYIRLTPADGDSACKALTGLNPEELTTEHPASAYFSRDSLNQRVVQGLFGRPALSSIMAMEDLRIELLGHYIRTAKFLTIVGSLIGGTGGGLLAPLIYRLSRASQAVNGPKIRAVFFGEWFRPDLNKIEGGQERFRSNQIFSFRSINEVSHAVNRYGIAGVTADEIVDRDSAAERKGRKNPWPSGLGHPVWLGTQMLYHLQHDATMDEPTSFKDKEIDRASFSRTTPQLDDARKRLQKAMGRASALHSRQVIRRMASDPLAERVWGTELVQLVRDFWLKAGGKESAPKFAATLQDEIATSWASPNKGLRNIFPPEPEEQAKPKSITSDVKWPRFVPGSVNNRLFEGLRAAERRAASTILFWSLRGS